MIVVLAIGLILALAAFSVDVSQWYVGRHQAQVVADAAALAAANCLSSTKCTQTTTNGDAATVAGDYSANTVNITGVSFSGSKVTVTTQRPSRASFAGLFGIPSITATATATASFNTLTSITFTCSAGGASNCLSLFAGNSYCPASAPNAPVPAVGLNLLYNDHGGGGATMTDVWTNGYFYNGANSGTYTGSGATCASDTKGPTTWTASTATNYPAVWTKPTCNFTAASYTSFSTPGVYCVTSPPSGGCSSSGSNSSTGSTAGYIDVTMSNVAAGAYEFVGPCVVITGSNASVTAIKGQPLVYGTTNITTAATAAHGLPTCTVNDGSTGTTTWLTGNGSSIDASIYDQCGTFEVTGNNSSFTGFVEAWNIAIDKNGGVTGDGPSSAAGGGEQVFPGGDSLTG